MLHAPHTHMILSRRLTHRTKFYRIKIPVPTTWESYSPIKGANTWVIWFWFWTWWDPQRCFFNPCTEPDGTGSCEAEPWWAKETDPGDWVNRQKYQASATASSKNWGPFLPSRQCSGNSTSFWFLYKLKFKIGGESIWTPVPRDPLVEGYIPSAPSLDGRTQEGQIQPGTRTPGHIGRPWTTHDILPFDLDEGILTDEALERITRGDEDREEDGQPKLKRRKLGRRPPRHLSRHMQRLLFRVLRRHFPMPQSIPDTPQNIP